MKLSKYTFIVKKDNVLLMYNCWSEKMTVIQPELFMLLKNNNIDTLKEKHPAFYSYLLSEKYIVENDIKEEKLVIEQWINEEHNPTSFGIFINPTLNCNMKCWYCYEEHRPKSGMSKKTFNTIVTLLKNKITNKSIMNFKLAFFGGEPLLEFDSIVMPLIRETEQLCSVYKKNLHVSFVTNSILLNENMIKQLSEIKVASLICFQITLDGDENYHNATKKSKEHSNVYRKTLSNIKMLIDNKMFVNIRFNTTHYNINSYYNVIPEFAVLSKDEKRFVNFDVQHVWQDSNYDKNEFEIQQMKLRNFLIEKGFSVSELKRIAPGRCYADCTNHIVVNYNGDLYKCTARDFIPSNKEGVLRENGDLIWNDKFKKRNLMKFGNANCQTCRIYPLCHGGCSQIKIERDEQTECYMRYDNEEKIKIIEDRIDFLLESITK